MRPNSPLRYSALADVLSTSRVSMRTKNNNMGVSQEDLTVQMTYMLYQASILSFKKLPERT